MLIVCPNCQTSYDVSAASLGSDGRQVRCVRCREVWHAMPTVEAPTAETVALSAAASAYQRGAAGAAEMAPPEMAEDPPAGEEEAAADDGLEIDDANLAARAADRATGHSDDSPNLDGDDDRLDRHVAPPLAPDHDFDAHARRPAEDIETVAARRARRAARRAESTRSRRSITLVIMPLVAVHIAILGWRSDVVRLLPQTASLFAAVGLPVNLRGVAFADVTTTKEQTGNVPVLVVQGKIANVSRQPHEVPRLRLALRNVSGTEVYSWTALPERTMLAPGDTEPFQTRLASPPAEGHELVVRFFTRRDFSGGVH